MSNRTMWRADGDVANPRMPTVSVLVVDTGYFHVMDVRIVRGRSSTRYAIRAADDGIVVNETLAQRHGARTDRKGARARLDQR
jgi:hypothetical protein